MASFPYPINYSLQTTLNPSSKKILAYRKWHGALSTLPGAIRDKDGKKEKYEREKKIEKKAEQRFWMKTKVGTRGWAPCCIGDQMCAAG